MRTLTLEIFDAATQARIRWLDSHWRPASASYPVDGAMNTPTDGDYICAGKKANHAGSPPEWRFQSSELGTIILSAGDPGVVARPAHIVVSQADFDYFDGLIKELGPLPEIHVKRATWFSKLMGERTLLRPSPDVAPSSHPVVTDTLRQPPPAPHQTTSGDRRPDDDGIGEFAFAAMFPDAAPWVHPRSMWSWYFWEQNRERRRQQGDFYGEIPGFPGSARQVVEDRPEGGHTVYIYDNSGAQLACWAMPEGTDGRSFDFGNGARANLGDSGIAFQGACGNLDWTHDESGRTLGSITKDDGSSTVLSGSDTSFLTSSGSSTGGGFGGDDSGGAGVTATAVNAVDDAVTTSSSSAGSTGY